MTSLGNSFGYKPNVITDRCTISSTFKETLNYFCAKPNLIIDLKQSTDHCLI